MGMLLLQPKLGTSEREFGAHKRITSYVLRKFPDCFHPTE